MFRIHALPVAPFQPLFALSDEELAARDIRRVVADGRPAYPCRVSLRDAEEGERLLLLPYVHHDVASPYRGSGPIYVREDAREAAPAVDEVPAQLRRRVLSLRAYDAAGMMRNAEVVDGAELEAAIARAFALAEVEYLHVHNAKPGCYACRVTRG
ncbi:MAG TPA: DUF1203 domain-containing protein [Lysobacter sp.]